MSLLIVYKMNCNKELHDDLYEHAEVVLRIQC